MVRRFVSRVLFWPAAAVVVALGMGSVAAAQSSEGLTAEKIDLIRQHCSSSQFDLQQIEKRDAVSRINRGRTYDQMLRQVSALNSRLAYNKISEPDLLQLTTDMQSGVDAFRAAYDHYDNDISDALNIDCKNKPVDYYQQINKVRNDRGTVADEVNAINDTMAKYRDAVANYGESLQ